MKIGPKTSVREMAFIVGDTLRRAGINAVLSGGGAASVYAPEAEQSQDLDFILGYWSAFGSSNECLLNLGFQEKNGLYRHADSLFTLEFPAGPLMIGSELITKWSTLVEDNLELQILSPTDCVRDRLSWFLFYGNTDYSALEQALAVAKAQPVDLDAIRDGQSMAKPRLNIKFSSLDILQVEAKIPSSVN